MVDSGCEPTQAFMQKYNLEFVGINVMMDGKRYVDGEQLLHEQFYAEVDRVKDIATQPPTQSDMIMKYKAIKAKGYERVIDFHMSSKLSDVFRNSEAAKGFVPGLEIHVIDTNSVSAGGFFVAEKVIDMVNEGRSMDEVNAMLPEITRSAQVLLSVSTLKYFVKNGRIGRAKGLVGNLLRMKPVLIIDDGLVTPFSTEKGMHKAIERMADASLEFLVGRPHNVKIFKAYGADNNKAFIDRAFDRLTSKLSRTGVRDYQVVSGRGWPTVTCHTGPEVFALSVYGERNPI
jgi:DegV family protein with EDD domain